jgi:two-component system osmolarity sensor histidine kinase EnvZ
MYVDTWIKRILPRRLLGRSLMIIFMPLVLLQVISAFVFYESHWDKVALRLARSVAGDIAVVISLMRKNNTPEELRSVFDLAEAKMQIRADFRSGRILPNLSNAGGSTLARTMAQAIREYVGKPFHIDLVGVKRHAVIEVQLSDGVLHTIVPHKRLYSSTTYIFVLWMAGTAMILFGLAVIFMRNQIKPILRLADAADSLGKGQNVASFKPEGAIEVRQAAAAFLAMRDRIQRQITQRTEMLAGVSHDLRTPLTRMKLQLALMEDTDGSGELRQDVQDMERMLEGYLAFARGEGTELPQPSDLNQILDEVVVRARRNGNDIDLHCQGEITLPIRPDAFRRCLTNLVENAARYGEHVFVRAGWRGDVVEIIIDDDGPGIAAVSREEVFRPFFRLEGSRNSETGGVGLGMTIARDVARGHGGDIQLDDSPTGGLRARVRIPL